MFLLLLVGKGERTGQGDLDGILMTNRSQVATRSLAAEKHVRAAAPAAGRRYAERSGSDETSGRDRKEGGKRHRPRPTLILDETVPRVNGIQRLRPC